MDFCGNTLSALGGALLVIGTSGTAAAQGDPAANLGPASGGVALGVAASNNAIEFVAGSGSCGSNSLQPVGWEFDVVNPVVVSAMTWFDDGLDGLSVGHEVGLWDPAGNLIASTHVTIPSGTTATLDGHWRVVSIPPTQLLPGAGYIAGGMNGQNGECLTSNVTQTVHPDLVFVDATYSTGTTLNRPATHSSATSGFYGVGFQIGGVPPGAFCFGDGSGSPCPCGNEVTEPEGCHHSGGVGARLSPGGTTSVASDDLTFHGTQLLPNQPGLLFAGQNAVNGGAGAIFGDGLRCAGGTVRRLGVRTADAAGASSWGPGLGAPGGWAAGDTRRFQVWYRDPVNSPCGSAFNLSHGVEVTFTP
ncbi:MAG: hypothetical protein H6828_03790 [Planctomycetes bacterium]|nr:hypothetical protein [Planctomycetota bacterium]